MSNRAFASVVVFRYTENVNLAPVAERLSEMLGPQHVARSPEVEVDGIRPGLVATPGNHADVLECLRLCNDAGAAVLPAGLMRWLDCGNPLRRADVVVTLARMNRLLEYSPADLTATVEAGMTIAELNRATSGERQWLPLDPPGGGAASLGAIAACASAGPLELGFGTPRDYILGLRLAHVGGAESKSGGRVVKNVAGYDMNKLYVGSWGTLAVITELTVKLRPLPERQATVIASAENPTAFFETARRIMNSELQPASLVLLVGQVCRRVRKGAALLARFIDCEEAVEYQLARLAALLPRREQLDGAEADAAWSDVADLDRLAPHAVRISAPPSQLESLVTEASRLARGCAMAASLGAGHLRIAFDADEAAAVDLIESLRRASENAKGSLTLERAPLGVRSRIDAWGDVGPALGIMRAIKSAFDPDGLLSPGRFVSGI